MDKDNYFFQILVITLHDVQENLMRLKWIECN